MFLALVAHKAGYKQQQIMKVTVLLKVNNHQHQRALQESHCTEVRIEVFVVDRAGELGWECGSSEIKERVSN